MFLLFLPRAMHLYDFYYNRLCTHYLATLILADWAKLLLVQCRAHATSPSAFRAALGQVAPSYDAWPACKKGSLAEAEQRGAPGGRRSERRKGARARGVREGGPRGGGGGRPPEPRVPRGDPSPMLRIWASRSAGVCAAGVAWDGWETALSATGSVRAAAHGREARPTGPKPTSRRRGSRAGKRESGRPPAPESPGARSDAPSCPPRAPGRQAPGARARSLRGLQRKAGFLPETLHNECWVGPEERLSSSVWAHSCTSKCIVDRTHETT